MDSLQQFISSLDSSNPASRVAVILFFTLVISLATKFLVSRLKNRSGRTATLWDDAFLESLGLPLGILVWVVGLTMSLNIALEAVDSRHLKTIKSVDDIAIIVVIAWFLVRLIRQIEKSVLARKLESHRRIDSTATEAIAKILRLCVFIIAGLMIMQILGFSIAGILTFGGIGGIAVGFAAQDLLSNFFGWLGIYMDRPFVIGDWVRSPDREIEGTVEEIGWRVTRIRTFDNRPLYVPNSAFTSISIENPSRMSHRRIYETIGIRYDDAGAIEKIVNQVNEYLKTQPDIDPAQSLMVNFTHFGPSSLDFFIYWFTRTRAWAEYNSIKQQVLLKVLEIIEQNGAEIAFPTTTLNFPENRPGPEPQGAN
jgi:MscS family membrane protein